MSVRPTTPKCLQRSIRLTSPDRPATPVRNPEMVHKLYHNMRKRPSSFRKRRMTQVCWSTMPSAGSIRVTFPFIYALHSYDWQTRCVVPSTVIFRRTGQTVEQARIGYIREIYARLSRTPCYIRFPASLNLDTWCYRTRGQIPYCDRWPLWMFPLGTAILQVH